MLNILLAVVIVQDSRTANLDSLSDGEEGPVGHEQSYTPPSHFCAKMKNGANCLDREVMSYRMHIFT